ncbi:hypothetical protein ABPG77_010265 [Micractinium sp. CCAP 211/92]
MGKRDREGALDPAVEDALIALQSTFERGGSELKLRALDKVIALVDPADDSYTAQKALVANDAAFFVTELLADPQAAPRAAEAVAALCRHSAPALARLAAGPLVGLDSSVERVALNPCQADFVDSGAIAPLVPMLVSRQETAREAAAEAVAALCSFHQEGKLAYLEGLVQLLQGGPAPEALPQVYELLEAAIDGMECGGEQAAQQLDLLPRPLLAELRGRGRPASLAALGLLGTLCEKHGAAAGELRDGGAVAAVAQHLLQGPQQVQDAAARALCLLASGDQACLSGQAGQLGCDPIDLAKALIGLLEAAEAQEASRGCFAAAQREAEEGSGGEGGGSPRPPDWAAERGAAEAEVCHAEEASQLLRVLASHHPAVEELVDEREVPTVRNPPSCCIS